MVELLAVTLLLAVDTDAAQMAAALHAETVTGDLRAAVSEYAAIVTRAKDNRPLAAQALLHLAECQEKLGQRAQARTALVRVLNEFGDQPQPAARARERLASWSASAQGPQNLDFERGQAGWSGPFEFHHEGCRTRLGCAVLPGSGRLTQTFPAAGYRGKAVRLRAWLRVEAGAEGTAQLTLGDDRMGVGAPRWTPYELAAEVDPAAQSVQFGVVSTGKARVWIDGVSLQVVSEPELSADRAAIQKLYVRLDAAYLQPDYDAIANLTVADAQYRDADVKEPFVKAVDRWTSVRAHHTAVTALKLSGNGAQVTARAEYIRSEANGTRSVSYVDTRLDTWVRNGAAWKLKEYRVLTTRQVDSTTDAQTAKRAAADLKQTAAPLATIEVGHTFYDLAPFGTAVGDARIVALGEATLGTREFFEVKHRLFEYLVKEKGFTVFAINATFLEASLLDVYITSGEGDAKALLTGMLWPWNTQEALEVVEWMKEFNLAAGTHATLRFASFGITPASVVIPEVVAYLQQYSPLDAIAAQTNYAALLEMESRLGEVYDDSANRAAEQADSVVRLLDARRELLVQASSVVAWRAVRQAAEMARQSAATRIAGRGSTFRNEMMARNIEWLARDAFPEEKIVIWGHNALVGYVSVDSDRSVGTWLREEFGERVYVTGFAFHRGELLAMGVQNWKSERVAKQTVPASVESNGDSVLSAAGMPVFFLDLHSVPMTSALGRWLTEPHSFLEVGALWNRDDPQSNSHLKTMAKSYDGLIFLEEGHAAHGL